MTVYHQPGQGLTAEERLLAEVISASQKMPCGFQIGMPMYLDHAIELVEQLFTKTSSRSRMSCLVSCGDGKNTPSKA